MIRMKRILTPDVSPARREKRRNQAERRVSSAK